MTTTLQTGLSLLLVALLALGPSGASAQTSIEHQRIEYERQQREYWRAQEQKREEERRLQQLQQDNARRQQEELNRAARQAAPGPQSPQYPSTQGSNPSASPGGGGRAAGRRLQGQAGAGERTQSVDRAMALRGDTGDAWRFAGSIAAGFRRDGMRGVFRRFLSSDIRN